MSLQTSEETVTAMFFENSQTHLSRRWYMYAIKVCFLQTPFANLEQTASQ